MIEQTAQTFRSFAHEHLTNFVDFASETTRGDIFIGVLAGLLTMAVFFAGRHLARLLIAVGLLGIVRFLDLADAGIDLDADLTLRTLLDVRNADGRRSILRAALVVHQRASQPQEIIGSTFALLGGLCFLVAVGAARSPVHSIANAIVGFILMNMAWRAARLVGDVKPSVAVRLLLVNALCVSLVVGQPGILEVLLVVGAAIGVSFATSRMSRSLSMHWVVPTSLSLSLVGVANIVSILALEASLVTEATLGFSAAMLFAASANLVRATRVRKL